MDLPVGIRSGTIPYTGAVNVKGEACDTCDFSIFPTDVFSRNVDC